MKINHILLILTIAMTGFIAVAVKVKLDKQKKPVVQQWQPPPQQEPVEPPPPKFLSLDEAVQTITYAHCKSYVYTLAAEVWEGRMSGKRGNTEAAAWIKKFHEKNGLPTEYQKFSIRRMNPGPKREQGDNFTQNIFTWIEGSDPVLKNEIVVLGAHLDHIGYGPSMSRSRRIAIHPGSDDNASGTAAIMEVAYALSKMKPPKRTIVIQHYSGEEMGLIGSRYYCDNPTFPKNGPDIRKHVAMINLDMIGFLGKGVYFAGFNDGQSSVDISRHIRELNGKYAFASKITGRRSGGSDHASFYNKRVPIAFLHTGLHPYYHTPNDTPDRLNYDGLMKISRYTLELIWRVANDPVTPVFHNESFKPMEYKHDHGHPEVPFPHGRHPHEHNKDGSHKHE